MEGDILILQLRQLGFDFLDATLTPAELKTEDLYASILFGLQQLGHLTKSERKKRFPSQLPAATASRFAIAQSVVAILHQAGCSAFGYDAMVYPVELSTKAVLGWLVAELGKVAEVQQHQQQADDDDHSLSALQRGVLALRRLVDSCETAGGKSRTTKVSLVPLRRRVVRETPRVFSHMTVAASQGGADDGQTSVVQQVSESYRQTFAKSLVFSDEPFKPSQSQVLIDSAVEAHACTLYATKGFQKLLSCTLSETNEMLPNSAPVLPLRPQSASCERRDRTLASLDAVFYNTSESGLSDNRAFAAEERARDAAEEAAVSAAVEDVAESERTAASRVLQREEEERELKSQLHTAKRALRDKREELQELLSAVAASRSRVDEIKAAQKEAEAAALASWEASKERQALLSLLDDPEANEIIIQQRIAEVKEKRRALKDELNAKLAKIDKKREQIVEENEVSGGGREKQLADLRQEIKEAKLKLKQRSKEVKSLTQDYEKCPKDIDRSGFLRLIFDMTANIRKQHQQLEKVKQEMTVLNATITGIEERLRSLFSAMEERVYASATAASSGASAGKPDKTLTDEFARQAYRNLVELQSSYASLVDTIQQRGVARQELHEVEEKTGKLRRLVGAYDLAKMSQDLELLQQENETLASQLDAK